MEVTRAPTLGRANELKRRPNDFIFDADCITNESIQSIQRKAGLLPPPPLPVQGLRPFFSALQTLPREVGVTYRDRRNHSSRVFAGIMDGIGYRKGKVHYHVCCADGSGDWHTADALHLGHRCVPTCSSANIPHPTPAPTPDPTTVRFFGKSREDGSREEGTYLNVTKRRNGRGIKAVATSRKAAHREGSKATPDAQMGLMKQGYPPAKGREMNRGVSVSERKPGKSICKSPSRTADFLRKCSTALRVVADKVLPATYQRDENESTLATGRARRCRVKFACGKCLRTEEYLFCDRKIVQTALDL